ETLGDETVAILNSRLLDWPPAELPDAAGAIGKLAGGSAVPSIRSHGHAVLMKLGREIAVGATDPDARKIDFLVGAKLSGRGKVPAHLESAVVALSEAGQSRAVRLAAAEALPLFPEDDQKSLERLVAIADAHAQDDLQLSFAALEAMKRVPASTWPAEYANRILTRIKISATPDLKFDVKEFTVKVGSAVELTFYNPDNMYHNLVLVDAGALDRVGLAADLMAGRPDGLEKSYVPDDPGVLQWTPQLTIGGARSHVLRFYAPEKAGDFPYICTFPGHWRAMRGVMKVVE
ncbi:MAG: hypothetical protein KDM63_06135, partial [Verrucomicrobiae bacterium]|nr:hypothetical protein [Verrucomicrobiae bacterium]